MPIHTVQAALDNQHKWGRRLVIGTAVYFLLLGIIMAVVLGLVYTAVLNSNESLTRTAGENHVTLALIEEAVCGAVACTPQAAGAARAASAAALTHELVCIKNWTDVDTGRAKPIPSCAALLGQGGHK